MDVYEAVKSRRAVRGFKDQPVSREVLERVLSPRLVAAGSNIQPWNIYVLTGGRSLNSRRAPSNAWPTATPGTSGNTRCIPALRSPYGERRSNSARSATARSALHAMTGRRAASGHRQLELFRRGPPPSFCYIDRDLAGPNGPTSACICRPIMLLLRAERTAPVARRWRGRRSRDSRGGPVTSRRPVSLWYVPIGYEIPRWTYAVRPRPLDETVTFVDDSA